MAAGGGGLKTNGRGFLHDFSGLIMFRFFHIKCFGGIVAVSIRIASSR
jgi:hypothetical protein